MAQLLQEALAKQKEDFKIKMDMAVQRVKDLYAQQLQQLLNQRDESSRRTTNHIDSDSEVEENINVDVPLEDKNTKYILNVRGGTNIPLQNRQKKDPGDDLKMKNLEEKINALMSAREVKRTGIPCPYPRE